MREVQTVDLRKTELSFLFAFVALRLLLFASYFSQFLGYDVRGHLSVVSAISWTHPFLPLNFSYYAWHPPFGFLLTHTIVLLGASPLLSAKILSSVGTLTAFFFMRQTLASLGLLQRLPVIVFLYVAASIPLQISLSVTVSLDVFVFCFASIALFLSVQIFWVRPGAVRSAYFVLMLVIILSLAILSKLSGFLLLPLPFLAWMLAGNSRTRTGFFTVILSTAVPFGVGCFFLYYRYYLPEHVLFFNSAGTLVWIDRFRSAIEARDAHPFRFFLSYVFPVDGGPRLLPTWASFWSSYHETALSTASALLGLIYYHFAILPCAFGAVAVLKEKTSDVWSRFGFLLLGCALFQFLGTCYYIYSLPILGFLSNKAVYIASASWAIAYLFVRGLNFLIIRRFELFGEPRLPVPEAGDYILAFAAFFMILNHLAPGLWSASPFF